jgi:4-diphosphocytidyl-2-C-methyl-D-erythritol kinase
LNASFGKKLIFGHNLKTAVIRFPNAKINIGLNVISKRNDGYHNLETIFYPVSWTDILEIIPAKDHTEFSVTGLTVAGDQKLNLCLKAVEILNQKLDFPSVKIHLHKIIPMGAGLGGGSSDCASTMMMLNEIYQLKLDEQSLINLALQAGSDCPFFIKNKPVFASGRGADFEDINISLKGYHIIIVKPDIHVSTAEAFSMITPAEPEYSLKDLINFPVEKWKDKIKNDFELPIFKINPTLKIIKEKLYDAGALYASMSGSGSAVYGIFKEKKQIIDLPVSIIKWEGILN